MPLHHYADLNPRYPSKGEKRYTVFAREGGGTPLTSPFALNVSFASKGAAERAAENMNLAAAPEGAKPSQHSIEQERKEKQAKARTALNKARHWLILALADVEMAAQYHDLDDAESKKHRRNASSNIEHVRSWMQNATEMHNPYRITD